MEKKRLAYSYNEKENSYEPGERNPSIVDDIPPGVYNLTWVPISMYQSKPVFISAPNNQRLTKITEEPFLGTAKKIVRFFSEDSKKVHKDFGLVHQMGVLLYGPPGTGKTCFIELVLKTLVNKYNAICLRVKVDSTLSSLIKDIRHDENTPIVYFIEEIDSQQEAKKEHFLSLLDGKHQINNFMVICTTNYFDKLSPQLINRPSRFALKQSIDSISNSVASAIIEDMIPKEYRDKINIPELLNVVEKEKLKIDQLKHIIIAVYTQNLTLKDAIEYIVNNKYTLAEDDDEMF